ncbi:hypothetical protein [Streptomyces justiciae]|uniref:Molecular chaperone DnaJ n=1 Tax=Streptomyces justiciae TaxID=2780140 RepID=A0ABU3LSP8_9ACTN|nr:hypothetical protein [Streptomyces justiciae]MDT7842244.1 hypothetical protein [Streptomyces justiciae]
MTGLTSASQSLTRVCPDCDGFASVKVTFGGRDRNGHLRTVTAHCPTCHGAGTRLMRRPRYTDRVVVA